MRNAASYSAIAPGRRPGRLDKTLPRYSELPRNPAVSAAPPGMTGSPPAVSGQAGKNISQVELRFREIGLDAERLKVLGDGIRHSAGNL